MQTNRVNKFPSTDVPRDGHLPGMRGLLDTEDVRNRFQKSVDSRRVEVTDCRIEHVRYKPGTSCVVAYVLVVNTDESAREVVCYGKAFNEGSWADAEAKAKARSWSQPELLPPVVIDNELRVILHVFPNDSELKGLRLFDEPKKLQRLFYEHYHRYPEADWRISDRKFRATVIRYKPEKRAVIELTSRAVHRKSGEKRKVRAYGRVYVDDRGRGLFEMMQQLNGGQVRGVEVPVPIAYLPDRNVVLLEHLDGAPMLDRTTANDVSTAAGRAATALCALHSTACKAERFHGVGEAMAAARVAAAALQAVAPELEVEVRAIVSRLEASVPGGGTRIGLVHGDFYHGQVLFRDAAVGIIDFDRAATGAQMTDVGNFCAHLRYLRLVGQLTDSAGAERAFVAAYESSLGSSIDPDELAFWTRLDLLLLAVLPFRTIASAWRERVTAIVDECMRISE